MKVRRAALRYAFALATVMLAMQASVSLQFSAADKIDPELRAAFTRQREVSYIIFMKEQGGAEAAATVADRGARGWQVYRALKATADRTQASVLAILAAEQNAGRVREVRSFFSVNAIGVVATALPPVAVAADPGVDRIAPSAIASIPPPQPGEDQPQVNAIEWNISKIRAPDVWSSGFTGQGIVVANIDTGVQFDHPALVNQYRGNLGGGSFDHNYNWADPPHACGNPSLVPCDLDSHGTHTMGTMVGNDGGANQIGVAPGARWIACNACPDGSCSTASLLACGNWVLAPTNLNGQNPDPTKRPDIVNNSWGSSLGGQSFYRTMVINWRAAGIFPAFANGNSGSACNTVNSPGDYPESFGVGATTMTDAIASFSSRGPSVFGGIVKPDVSAPGANVRSSVPPNSYAAFSGTSMATPHVAGMVALLWSKYPNLRGDVSSTEQQIRPSAITLNSAQGCGGKGPTDHPNNVFGWGRIDAVRANAAFGVHTDRSVYTTGQTITATISLVNRNAGPFDGDFYLAAQGPTGPASLIAMFPFTMAGGLKAFNLGLFTHVWTASDPPGSYALFSIMTAHGADVTNLANWLSFDMTSFSKQ